MSGWSAAGVPPGGGTERRHAGVPLVLLALVLFSCARPQRAQTIEFWGLGREGEVVTELLPQFERETGIKVDVQQIPWTAAHEKILTAHVGGSLPDALQVGNSWMSELVTIGAIVPLEETLVDRADYFGGIWDTNVVGGTLYGIPWYVDTRLLFYRTDMIPTPPRTWSEWMAVMEKLKRENKSRDFYPIVMPTNEWPQPVILALQRGAVLVDDDARARFDDPRFIEGFSFYVEMFRRGYAPAVSNTQVANIYQQFGEGHIAMWITGPWDVGNLRTRLTPEQQKTWSTAPLPSPDGVAYPGVSLAGGSSLVVSKRSRKPEAAKKLIAFLSRPDIQARFYELSGDLPARKSAWNAPGLVGDRELGAFAKQLDRTVALPRLPEAENIVNLVAEHGQMAVRGQYTARQAALALDAKVDAMLEKRRWVLQKQTATLSAVRPPLTLALSPQAGRGNWGNPALVGSGREASHDPTLSAGAADSRGTSPHTVPSPNTGERARVRGERPARLRPTP